MKKFPLLLITLLLSMLGNAQAEEEKAFAKTLAEAGLTPEETTEVIAIHEKKLESLKIIKSLGLDKEIENLEINKIEKVANKKMKALVGDKMIKKTPSPAPEPEPAEKKKVVTPTRTKTTTTAPKKKKTVSKPTPPKVVKKATPKATRSTPKKSVNTNKSLEGALKYAKLTPQEMDKVLPLYGERWRTIKDIKSIKLDRITESNEVERIKKEYNKKIEGIIGEQKLSAINSYWAN